MLAIFSLSIGISTTRTKQKKLDLRKLISRGDQGSDERWILANRAASGVEYRNQQAVMFDSRSGKGLAWVEGLRFSVGKIDLNIAAVKQDVGIAFHVRNEREFEAVCFYIEDEARGEGASQRVVIQYLSTYQGRSLSHEAQFDLPYSQSGEWFKARIAVSKEVVAVFISGDNLPTLSVDTSERGEFYGSVGVWIGPGSSALVADFRIHVVRSDIEQQIKGIFGRRPMG